MMSKILTGMGLVILAMAVAVGFLWTLCWVVKNRNRIPREAWRMVFSILIFTVLMTMVIRDVIKMVRTEKGRVENHPSK